MTTVPPVAVQEFGQSIWLDYIHRQDLQDGALHKLIDENGVVGVTSNPSIFQKAIGESDVYDSAMQLILELEPEQIYEQLAIEDIQNATDLFRPIYDKTDGKDGYVSLEVSPKLAHDTAGTCEEARRLATAVNRPNLMIKIPATPEGIPAIEETIAAGINVNVTLIFAVDNYREVAEAYIRGLERRLEAGEDITKMASVASFFLSRIDVMVDRILENNIRTAQVHGDTARISANRKLLGQAAVASAKLAYRAFQNIFEGTRFKKLAEAGAMVQRPLWASTSTKNPSYPDTKYVDTLIGKDTVNTLPPKTLDAFTDHGTVAETLTKDLDGYIPGGDVMDQLAEVGVDIDQVTNRLQVDGVDAFIDAFEKLIDQVRAKRTVLTTGVMERQNMAMGVYADALQNALKDLDSTYVNSRIWAKEGGLWKDHGPTIAKIENRLGWLDVFETIDQDRLQALQQRIEASDFEHIILLGMGGSSLAPEVLWQTFGQQEGFPNFTVLDSTDPSRIQNIEDSIAIDKTLFIVATKSGTTVETLSFYKYFYEKTGGNGKQFIAITDEGSQLQTLAEENNFYDIFINPSDIGGRYSALSYFGMVPAATMGLRLDHLWFHAERMFQACGENVPGKFHPGLNLGAVIGALTRESRDKVAIFCSDSISTFGNWVEQLIAESTGKEGRGILPVVGATIGMPHDYATDRLIVYMRVDNDPDADKMDAGIRALREAGHPRVTLRLPDAYAIAGEFLRWEYATAVAGLMINVNPFDEPNVTEAKDATKALLEEYKEQGNLPQTAPVMQRGNVSLYATDTTMEPLQELCRAHGYNNESLIETIAAQIAGTHAGDYFAILAYLTADETAEQGLLDIQRKLRHTTKRAVTIGYGPRYLHSTGQLHKGGANNGVFIQITVDTPNDIPIPDAPYSFGTLFTAQAAGDLQALDKHGRRALRLHIAGDDYLGGLQVLLDAIEFVKERRR